MMPGDDQAQLWKWTPSLLGKLCVIEAVFFEGVMPELAAILVHITLSISHPHLTSNPAWHPILQTIKRIEDIADFPTHNITQPLRCRHNGDLRTNVSISSQTPSPSRSKPIALSTRPWRGGTDASVYACAGVAPSASG